MAVPGAARAASASDEKPVNDDRAEVAEQPSAAEHEIEEQPSEQQRDADLETSDV